MSNLKFKKLLLLKEIIIKFVLNFYCNYTAFMNNYKGNIIKSGSCLVERQIEDNTERGKNLRMDFQLSDDGVLIISGNTVLCPVPAADAILYCDDPWGESCEWSEYVSQFEDLDFHTVIIEDGVRRLGELCFKNCKGLHKIILPENMPIIRSSFAKGSPLEYTISNKLKFLGPPSNPYYYLFGCEDDFNEKKLIVPPGTVKIADEAFKGKTCIKEVTLPESLEFAGWYTFEDTSIREIFIPEGVLARDEVLLAFDGNPGAPLEMVSLPYSMYRAYKDGQDPGLVVAWNRECHIIYRNQDDTIAEILAPKTLPDR